MSDTKTIMHNGIYVCPKKRVKHIKPPKNWDRANIQPGSRLFGQRAAAKGENERLQELGFNKTVGGKSSAPQITGSSSLNDSAETIAKRELRREKFNESILYKPFPLYTSPKTIAIISLTRIRTHCTNPNAIRLLNSFIDWNMGIRLDKPVF